MGDLERLTNQIAQVHFVLTIIQFFQRLKKDFSTTEIQLTDRRAIDDNIGKTGGWSNTVGSPLSVFQIDTRGIQQGLTKVISIEIDDRRFETKDFDPRDFVYLETTNDRLEEIGDSTDMRETFDVLIHFTAFILTENRRPRSRRTHYVDETNCIRLVSLPKLPKDHHNQRSNDPSDQTVIDIEQNRAEKGDQPHNLNG